MKTGKVIGTIWATRKEEKLAGLKLLVIQPVNLLDDKPIEYPIVAAHPVFQRSQIISQCQVSGGLHTAE